MDEERRRSERFTGTLLHERAGWRWDPGSVGGWSLLRSQRDRHLQLIAERGRMAWQKATGYNRRALVETAIGRYKRGIGDALRSRTDGRQATEVTIAVRALNHMLELGRKESIRVA